MEDCIWGGLYTTDSVEDLYGKSRINVRQFPLQIRLSDGQASPTKRRISEIMEYKCSTANESNKLEKGLPSLIVCKKKILHTLT